MCGSAIASRMSRDRRASASRPTRAASPPPRWCWRPAALSIPKMGATGFTYDVARRFGLRVTETLPGLVPLTATPDALGLTETLSGVSLDADRVLRHARFPREHPVHPSRTVRPGDPADLVLLAAGRDDRARSAAGARRRTLPQGAQARPPEGGAARPCLASSCPARLARSAYGSSLPDETMANIPDRTLDALRGAPEALARSCRPARKATPRPRSPSAGSTPAICRRRRWKPAASPGLYAIGEAVDVTGWLGGYNFQWAWSSGWCAGPSHHRGLTCPQLKATARFRAGILCLKSIPLSIP